MQITLDNPKTALKRNNIFTEQILFKRKFLKI